MNVELQPRQSEPRDVVAGDHVYYGHAEHGPQTGEVVSVGRDGFRCAHARDGGGQDTVRWDDMLGHKARKQRRFVMVDSGEDGSIARAEDGKMHFIRGASPQPEPMGKAHPAVEAALGQPELAEAMHLLGLELSRAQMEHAAMVAAAIERLAQIVAGQSAQVAALVQALAPQAGESNAGSVLQGDPSAHAAQGLDASPGSGAAI